MALPGTSGKGSDPLNGKRIRAYCEAVRSQKLRYNPFRITTGVHFRKSDQALRQCTVAGGRSNGKMHRLQRVQ